MSRSLPRTLPEGPNLESERKRAKKLLRAWRAGDADALARLRAHHPRFAAGAEFAPDALKLADALLVAAREAGFASWPRLKHHVEELAASFEQRLELFVDAACSGDVVRAERLLARDPGLAHADFVTACVVADEERVRAALEADASLATRAGGPKGWPPLVYLALSKLGADDPAARRARYAIAQRLLALGADPNATTATPEKPEEPLSPLYGAVGRNDQPELAKLLLEAGADPNDGESLYHAAEQMHGECLTLLLAHGVDPNEPGGSWRVTPLHFLLGYREAHAMARVADLGIRWLLENGADPDHPSGDEQETALHRAAGNGRGTAVAELLAAHGADLRARRRDGRTPYELAVLRGNAAVAAWLAERGAATPLSPGEALLEACGRADAAAARSLLDRDRDLVSRLDAEQRALVCWSASWGHCDAVALMLDLGFAIDARGSDGETALHAASWIGHEAMVALLLEHGPPLDALCAAHGSPPLGWCAHGSAWCRSPGGDYAAVAERLVAAGADVRAGGNRWGATLTEMASDEVAELLRAHGAADSL